MATAARRASRPCSSRDRRRGARDRRGPRDEAEPRRRPSRSADPLAALVARSKHPESTPPEAVHPSEVTFPSMLSDSDCPTTALAAVKDERGHLVGTDADDRLRGDVAPPPPADKLPVVPLPAGTLLDETSVTKDPKDALTRSRPRYPRSTMLPL